MHDFSCTKANDMHYPVLAERVRYFKENVKEVTAMCREVEKLVMAERDEGRAEGRAEGNIESSARAVRNVMAKRSLCGGGNAVLGITRFGKRCRPETY